MTQPREGGTGSAYLDRGYLEAEPGSTEHDACGPQDPDVSPTFSLATARDLWVLTPSGSRTPQRSTWTLRLHADKNAIASCW